VAKKSKDSWDKKFPIVGIGASAGGLEAFEKFFLNMPPDSGIGFVLIPHLAPTHKSIMGDLLKKYTEMEVNQVEDGMRVEPNHVYVIPPNKDMAIINGNLQLMQPDGGPGLRHPVDYFFRSLAQDQREMAICIILSGTGTEGTLGLKAIKEEGGMVMAQDPSSAKYDGMPQSAISTNLVDNVLPPEKMGNQLLKYVKGKYLTTVKKVRKPIEGHVDTFMKILILIRNKTGHDFSQYKQTTIIRRIEKRMALHQIPSTSDYVKYLQKNPAEVELLFKELLIGVTNFFRDPEAFELLKNKVIPYLLQEKSEDRAIRVWVPGCSTGEEAYSIAMVFQDVLGKLKQVYNIQVFGTEIDENAIQLARKGVYPDSIAVDVPQRYLKQFFIKEGNTFRVKNEIRDMIIFAPQAVFRDPPFSKIEMISCRNLLIYLGPELQKSLIGTFHYSLNPGGILFLGTSEGIGRATDLFSIFDKKWRFFKRRVGVSPPLILSEFRGERRIAPLPVKNELGIMEKPRYLDLRELTEKFLLDDYTPSCAIINDKGDIHYLHGRTGRYLEPAPGEAHMNLIEMAREGLRLELGTAIHKAATKKKEVVYKDLQIKTNGEIQGINLTVKPINEPQTMEGLMIVLFEDIPTPKTPKSVKKIRHEARADERVKSLERELRAVKENLRSTIEETEASNEELKSANEELQSTNEELQSTNEELETSKEELQSVNEELVTVNSEHQEKIDELSLANNDLNNLINSTEIGTIFLDMDLNVRRFTPKATGVIKIIPSDLGRPVTDIAWRIKDADLAKDAKEVLKTLAPKEIETRTDEGLLVLIRLLPYQTLENVIDGVVITFTDITSLETMRRLATVVKDSNDAVTVQDLEGNITAWNRGAEKMYGWSEAEALKMNIVDIIPKEKKKEALEFIKEMKKGKGVESFETTRKTKSGQTRDIRLTVSKLTDKEGKLTEIATTERDITREERLRQQ
jgi:two-component system CheB/CheR fusion protein